MEETLLINFIIYCTTFTETDPETGIYNDIQPFKLFKQLYGLFNNEQN